MADASPLIPDEHSRQAAAEASRLIAPLRKLKKDTRVVLSSTQKKSPAVEAILPPVAVDLLVRALNELAQGHAVTLLPTHAELTTQQAADLLNVSRPFLIGLLEAKKIPYRKVGNRRRILAADLFKYREQMDADTRRAAEDLTTEAQGLGIEY